MTSGLEATRLFKHLKKQDPRLAERVRMVRDAQAQWLPLIVASFPHYPNHGVEHSERIIDRLSRLLFERTKPVVAFSTAEVYCLLCAAYLHDMGMVVPPRDVDYLFASQDWSAFVTEGGAGHDAYLQYATLRKEVDSRTDGAGVADFRASQVLRYLIADFVRISHHERGKASLELHPFLRQLVTDNDSVAFETIADIGVGHGLPEKDLEDDERFPDERDVFGEKVNVRFLTRLLRIGDLLDLDSKRADPMTALGVSSLPPSAVPHWKQYSTKRDENISPREIKLTFECDDHDVHRVLRDWLGWLEQEVCSAGASQRHAKRHSDWREPRCSVESQSTRTARSSSKPTILIRPSSRARYSFHDWKLELDHERVLDRLIYDVYESPATFLRELLQNALDATRCQMYRDVEALSPESTAPDRPTRLPKELRDRYPIILSLKDEEVCRSPDEKPEQRSVLTIEDHGTGMTEEIIRRYFLQVGRSYYDSKEFREQYNFSATSRFGVGFLSVFAVSDHVIVETQARSQLDGADRGVRLSLKGPRSYILTEQWEGFAERTLHRRHGTRIRVVLRDDVFSSRSLHDVLADWCVQLEVPIVVRERDRETTIRYAPLEDGLTLKRSSVGGKFSLRVFDLDRDGVEGQIAVVAYTDEHGEAWCDRWPRDTNIEGDRIDTAPAAPASYKALNGIAFLRREYAPYRSRNDQSLWAHRVDVRSRSVSFTLSRDSSTLGRGHRRRSGVDERCDEASRAEAERVIASHLSASRRARGPRGIYYIGSVLDAAPVSSDYQLDYPATIVTWESGRRVDRTAREVLSLAEIGFVHCNEGRVPINHPGDCGFNCPILSLADTPLFFDRLIRERLRQLYMCGSEFVGDTVFVRFALAPSTAYPRPVSSEPWYLIPLQDDKLVAVLPGTRSALETGAWSLVNSRHPAVQWLIRLQATIENVGAPAISPRALALLWSTISVRSYEWRDRIPKFRRPGLLPSELAPPGVDYLRTGWLSESSTLTA